MRSSSVPLVLLLVVLGCSRAVAHPPAPPAAAVPAAGAPPAAVASGALDPSEEITAGELASIPEPVSTSVAAANGIPAETTATVAAEQPGAAKESGSIWRVQIFASQDLAQADRVAKEASARFGEPAVIEFEGSLYKVRLGAFRSEALAQTLRERAVSGGFPGAFRMRSSEVASDARR